MGGRLTTQMRRRSYSLLKCSATRISCPKIGRIIHFLEILIICRHEVATIKTISDFWKNWNLVPQPSDLLLGKRFVQIINFFLGNFNVVLKFNENCYNIRSNSCCFNILTTKYLIDCRYEHLIPKLTFTHSSWLIELCSFVEVSDRSGKTP